VATVVDQLVYFSSQVARDQRLRTIGEGPVPRGVGGEFDRSPHIPRVEHLASAACDEKADLRKPPSNDSVQAGSTCEIEDGRALNLHLCCTVEYGGVTRADVGWHLRWKDHAVVNGDNVRDRTADVDADHASHRMEVGQRIPSSGNCTAKPMPGLAPYGLQRQS
jgi:hypothetical protein